MLHKVGPKGQLVVEKEFRQQLGVEPGWIALQRVVGDHLEIRFLPPANQGRSLKGSLTRYAKAHIGSWEEWDEARELAWRKAAFEKAGKEAP